MTFRELPITIKSQVENLEMSADIKSQCLDTLTMLAPEKETIIAMLVEKYAEQCMKEAAAEEELHKAGLNVSEVRLAYWKA